LRERERKGLYVQSTQIGYIRTSKAWGKKEIIEENNRKVKEEKNRKV